MVLQRFYGRDRVIKEVLKRIRSNGNVIIAIIDYEEGEYRKFINVINNYGPNRYKCATIKEYPVDSKAKTLFVVFDSKIEDILAAYNEELEYTPDKYKGPKGTARIKELCVKNSMFKDYLDKIIEAVKDLIVLPS